MKPDFDYLYVMDEVVGEIPMLPDFNTALVSTIAKAFDTSVSVVNAAHNRMKKKGLDTGERRLTVKDFISASWDTYGRAYFIKDGFKIRVLDSIRTFTKEGIFALAHEMPNNEKAKEIRNRIWRIKCKDVSVIPIEDVAVNTPKEKFGGIQIFTNEKFGNMRTMEINGEPWFVGRDVAEALGYERPAKAIQDHVDEEDKDAVPIRDSIGRGQKSAIINESGLYSLILSSKLPSAKEFKRWVTHDVIPAIRKTGGYIMGEEAMTDEELLAKAVMISQVKIAERDKRIEELSRRNLALVATNNALSGELCEHEPRYVFRRLAQEYGRINYPWMDRGTQIRYAYGRFYREISDKFHFDVHLRYKRAGEIGYKSDYITEEEWPLCVKCAAAICIDSGVDIGAILNNKNKEKYAS